MSVIYGNGYNKCGPISYTFFDLDGKVFDSDFFSNQVKRMDTFADVLTLRLDSEISGT